MEHSPSSNKSQSSGFQRHMEFMELRAAPEQLMKRAASSFSNAVPHRRATRRFADCREATPRSVPRLTGRRGHFIRKSTRSSSRKARLRRQVVFQSGPPKSPQAGGACRQHRNCWQSSAGGAGHPEKTSPAQQFARSRAAIPHCRGAFTHARAPLFKNQYGCRYSAGAVHRQRLRQTRRRADRHGGDNLGAGRRLQCVAIAARAERSTAISEFFPGAIAIRTFPSAPPGRPAVPPDKLRHSPPRPSRPQNPPMPGKRGEIADPAPAAQKFEFHMMSPLFRSNTLSSARPSPTAGASARSRRRFNIKPRRKISIPPNTS